MPWFEPFMCYPLISEFDRAMHICTLIYATILEIILFNSFMLIYVSFRKVQENRDQENQNLSYRY